MTMTHMTTRTVRRARWGIHLVAGAAIVLTACGPLASSENYGSAPDSDRPDDGVRRHPDDGRVEHEDDIDDGRRDEHDS